MWVKILLLGFPPWGMEGIPRSDHRGSSGFWLLYTFVLSSVRERVLVTFLNLFSTGQRRTLSSFGESIKCRFRFFVLVRCCLWSTELTDTSLPLLTLNLLWSTTRVQPSLLHYFSTNLPTTFVTWYLNDSQGLLPKQAIPSFPHHLCLFKNLPK